MSMGSFVTGLFYMTFALAFLEGLLNGKTALTGVSAALLVVLTFLIGAAVGEGD